MLGEGALGWEGASGGGRLEMPAPTGEFGSGGSALKT